MLVSIGGVDITKYIDSKSYEMNSEADYKSWKDGWESEHRKYSIPKVNGSFDVVLYGNEDVAYADQQETSFTCTNCDSSGDAMESMQVYAGDDGSYSETLFTGDYYYVGAYSGKIFWQKKINNVWQNQFEAVQGTVYQVPNDGFEYRFFAPKTVLIIDPVNHSLSLDGFIDLWENTVNNHIAQLSVFVKNLNQTKEINAYYTFKGKSHKLMNNNRYFDVITVEIKEK